VPRRDYRFRDPGVREPATKIFSVRRYRMTATALGPDRRFDPPKDLVVLR
jgi:hypothetical protein